MTEPDLSRCGLIPPNPSRRGHNEVRSRESLSLKNAYMYTLQVKKEIATCR